MSALPVENVQTYPRPPFIAPVVAPIRLMVDGIFVAETTAALRVCETHHAPCYYIPPGDIADGLLRPGGGRSWCEWKGTASYFDLMGASGNIQRGAWTYLHPREQFAAISGAVGFYLSDRVRGWVDGIEATPQPGNLYGGWVTPNLTGQIKGPPGTRHW
jgi:uncharacterized protein (DUF427 family)